VIHHREEAGRGTNEFKRSLYTDGVSYALTSGDDTWHETTDIFLLTRVKKRKCRLLVFLIYTYSTPNKHSGIVMAQLFFALKTRLKYFRRAVLFYNLIFLCSC